MAKLDLHCHSTASDGALPPAELVARAAAQVDVLAGAGRAEAAGAGADRHSQAGAADCCPSAPVAGPRPGRARPPGRWSAKKLGAVRVPPLHRSDNLNT